MNESYLHFLWKSKRFDSRNLKLVCGRTINILNVGWHNPDAGPDFFNGTVDIDGIKWTGNIEIHIRSSDWYAHQHQKDDAYNNVILHVVYEYNKPVYIKEKEVPTLVLKHQIDPEHLLNYQQFFSLKKEKPCAEFLSKCHSSLSDQIRLAFFHRIERKGLALVHDASVQKRNANDTLLLSLAKAFGGRLNRKPMAQLATGLTMKTIWKEKWSDERMNALFLGKAGFLENSKSDYSKRLFPYWKMLKRKYEFSEMNVSSWKYKGVRPSSFPTRRVAEFAQIAKQLYPEMASLNTNKELKAKWKNLLTIELDDFWVENYSLDIPSKRKNSAGLSRMMKHKLFINAIAPFLIYRKHVFAEYHNDELIVDLLSEIAPEENKVTKQWKQLGVPVENAVDSQGLLELNNEFCIFRKCLSCQVGKALLDR
tara:strand:+ start:46885 stop:48153 length:1269 start_codon:yes stop_codon:yes gene_type:complete